MIFSDLGPVKLIYKKIKHAYKFWYGTQIVYTINIYMYIVTCA